MSLAAPLSDAMRPGSFLPVVKCSDCGHEIEISAMGDHICSGAAQPEVQMPSETTYQSNPYESNPYGGLSNQSNPYQSNLHQGNPYQATPYQKNPYESVYMGNPFSLKDTPPTSPSMNANGFPATSPLQYSQQPGPPSPEPQPPVPALPFNTNPVPSVRAPRPAPPRINSDFANSPFLPKPSRLESPISPAISSRSGGSFSGRSNMGAPSPLPRPSLDLRPPSPKYSANLDCAFPPFPASTPTTSSRPTTANGRRTPSTNRVPSRAGSRQDSRLGNDRAFDFDKASPANEDTSYRVDTPTDTSYNEASRRPSEPKAPVLDRRQDSFSSINLFQAHPPLGPDNTSRPSTSGSNGSRPLTSGGSNFSRPGAPAQLKQTPPYRPERPSQDTVLSPRFLDQFSEEPSSVLPLEPATAQPVILPPSPEKKMGAPYFPPRGESISSEQDNSRGRPRRPTLDAVMEDPSNPRPQFRARSSSRSAPRTDFRMQDAPPVPRPVHQYRQGSSHTPSESGSSTMSSFHSNSSSVRGSSPVESPASSVDIMSPLSSVASFHNGDEDRMRVAGLNYQNKQRPAPRTEEPGIRAEQPSQKSPPRNFARPAALNGAGQIAPSSDSPASYNSPLESPMDPALQDRQLMQPSYDAGNVRPPLGRTATAPLPDRQMPRSPMPPLPESQEYDAYQKPAQQSNFPPRTRSKSNAAYPPRSDSYSSTSQNGDQSYPPPPPIPQGLSTNPALARRPSAKKPSCRGCGLKIEGKSVKAADGRLTGRWHKACFTCKTCNEAFTTADFYVIDNQPYCEQHYHEKNGSLCHGCHRGIEGQYLETTSSTAIGTVDRKFHPRCFTCVDCRLVLRDDYFEIHGRVYCERHALAAMRVQQGRGQNGLYPSRQNWTAERRTTRLMMM